MPAHVAPTATATLAAYQWATSTSSSRVESECEPKSRRAEGNCPTVASARNFAHSQSLPLAGHLAVAVAVAVNVGVAVAVAVDSIVAVIVGAGVVILN